MNDVGKDLDKISAAGYFATKLKSLIRDKKNGHKVDTAIKETAAGLNAILLELPNEILI